MGLGGKFVLGAGYNINKANAIIGEFLYSGLPSNLHVLQAVKALSSRMNLSSLTVNYRHQCDRISGSPFGLYFIGGGWYQRYHDRQALPAAVPCAPIWYGYGCDGVVYRTWSRKGA